MVWMKWLGSMSLKVAISLLLICVPVDVVLSDTYEDDVISLTALMELWQNVPPTWSRFGDPCGDFWEGIQCSGSRVISITLSSMGLKGTLSGDIEGLSELKTLDLSYNKGLAGFLPPVIGTLSKLTSLILVGCSFSGEIPASIGSLSELVFLSLNSNGFTGKIPNSMGNLSKLYWLDLADNRLTGSIPVSNGTIPGLDMLINTKHFHFGKNQLSGAIPPMLFNGNMTLIHLLLDNNQLTGIIPPTLGLVKKLEVVRLDWNSLSGSVPSNISNLSSVTDLLLSNNQLTGTIPDLTGMNLLSYLDMSNNTFEVSDIPPWFTSLPSLTTLMMERSQIQGTVPAELFNLPQLQKVVLKKNRLSGTLDIGEVHSSQMQLIDLQNNNISAYTQRPIDSRLQLILAGNPVCGEKVSLQTYCILPENNPSYSTSRNCAPIACNSDETSSPNCHCAYPYSGTLEFRAPLFSDLQNFTYYKALEQQLMTTFQSNRVPVDTVSLSNISRDSSNYLYMDLEIFPLGQNRFNRTGVFTLGFILANQTFKPPPYYGPFVFSADEYASFAKDPGSASAQGKRKLSLAAIIGIAVGGSAVLLVSLSLAVVSCRTKRSSKTVEPANRIGLPSSASWMSPGSTSSTLQLTGPRVFSFEDVKKITNNFSEANGIGSGAYGKVYKGTLPDGHLVAIKRAEQRSKQGGLEFKTEIELLSRVHHKNVVTLLGFCLENGEIILVYEYVPNGTLRESLSGKSGIRLDWRRRIKVAVGAARGLAYLHELANPPIIHRDIKSNNILLDENLNAKVSDFGLSKPLTDAGKDHVTTEVKGTMGYLDPEYYMTRKLSEKSDVYSFGVLMLELITGRPPIDKGRYIVKEVRKAMNTKEDLYGLQELLDHGIGLGTTLKGFEKYVDLAVRCVQESGDERPVMGEVVKQLEDIMEMAGLNPYTDSATSSATFDHRQARTIYGDESLNNYSRALPR